MYLCPVIKKVYDHKMVHIVKLSLSELKLILVQAHVIEQHSGVDVVVAGDGRCDSPGKCAKFLLTQ